MSLSTPNLTHEPSETLQKVSDYFLYISDLNKKPITNKKLQKLAYYAQAWHLVFTGNKLFPDTIEAWLHGPAIRTLWKKYRDFGYMPITTIPSKPSLNDSVESLLEEIWYVYGKHDADYLEALTHSEQPWLAARDGLEANQLSSIEINTDSMKQYYSELNDRKVN